MPTLSLAQLTDRHQLVIDGTDDIYNPQSPINANQAYTDYVLRQNATLKDQLDHTSQELQEERRISNIMMLVIFIALAIWAFAGHLL